MMVPRSGGTSIKPSITIIMPPLLALSQECLADSVENRKGAYAKRTGLSKDKKDIKTYYHRLHKPPPKDGLNEEIEEEKFDVGSWRRFGMQGPFVADES
jgi:hypothetical protein